MQYIRERKKESTQKLIKHTRVGVAMINTEQDNNNIVLFSTIVTVHGKTYLNAYPLDKQKR